MMNGRLNIYKITFLTFVLFQFVLSSFAQKPNVPAPRQEKLLNGLKVLMWSDPAAQQATVRIRIHSGSAFDPQGKEGVMQMLADNFFPNATVREFFTDDLGGSLEIVSNYDFVQINGSAKSEEFLTLVETLAQAVSSLVIDKEITAKLKAAQLEKIKELEKNPGYIADQMVAKRLLGSFPYGRPPAGTLESVGRIDYADLLFAKERFLTADNATVAITGNLKPDLAFRAVRRYFGAWTKSDKQVPSTFRQPDDPDTKPFVVKLSTGGNSETRYALRGLARNDKDYVAAEILTKILQYRLQNLAAKQSASNVFVRHDGHILPGLFIFGYASASPATSGDGKTINLPDNVILHILSPNISTDEFSKAKTETSSEIKSKLLADWWLDVDTFKLVSAADEIQSFDAVTPADVQRVAERLSKNPTVTISVTPSGETAVN